MKLEKKYKPGNKSEQSDPSRQVLWQIEYTSSSSKCPYGLIEYKFVVGSSGDL